MLCGDQLGLGAQRIWDWHSKNTLSKNALRNGFFAGCWGWVPQGDSGGSKHTLEDSLGHSFGVQKTQDTRAKSHTEAGERNKTQSSQQGRVEAQNFQIPGTHDADVAAGHFREEQGCRVEGHLSALLPFQAVYVL